MDLSLRSFVAYAFALAFLVVAFMVWAAFSLAPRVTIRPREPRDPEGHFHWANGEMEQIAGARDPTRREPDPRMAATLFRAELEVEVGRIISELSDDRRGASRPNVAEAFVRGVGMVRAYGLMQRRLSELEHRDPLDARIQPGDRFQQLRLAMETGGAKPGAGGGRALIGSRG
jgi:hypothetical protein